MDEGSCDTLPIFSQVLRLAEGRRTTPHASYERPKVSYLSRCCIPIQSGESSMEEKGGIEVLDQRRVARLISATMLSTSQY